MGKFKKPTNPPTPNERKIRTRSTTLRKKSMDESIDSQNRPFLEEYGFIQRESSVKSKYFPYNEDIDIYFASCFNSNYKSKEESHQMFEKESTSEKSSKETKKPIQILVKPETMDEVIESHAQSSLVSIEEANESEKQEFEPEQPRSPIFGRKMMKNFKTPPNKLDELKVFDQSEQIPKELIDQLEGISKEVSSPSDNPPSSTNPINNILNIEVTSPVFKTEKKIQKEKRTTSNKKKLTIVDYFSKPDLREFSFKRHGLNDEIRRRTQILRLSSLTLIHSNYDRSERILMSLDNAINGLMNYYNLRELNTKLLAFRANVFRTCREEIERMKSSIREKKEICFETIHDKLKQGDVIHYFDEKMVLPQL